MSKLENLREQAIKIIAQKQCKREEADRLKVEIIQLEAIHLKIQGAIEILEEIEAEALVEEIMETVED